MNALARVPLNFPSNEDAEKGLLGAILVRNSAYDKVSDFLRAEHFHFPVHGRIYAAIASMLDRNQSCSAVILKKAFEGDGDLEQIGGAGYIADLMTHSVTVTQVAADGRQIFDLYQRRQTMALCDETILAASVVGIDNTAPDIIAGLEAGLYGIAESAEAESSTKSFSASIVDAIQSAENAYRGDPRARGITTGLIDVDAKIGGLKAPDLVTLAARPGMGKTALAAGIAWKAAQTGKTVAFFSLEMSAEQIATRIMSALAGVPADLVRKGKVTPEQFRLFVTASQELASLPLYINDRGGQTIGQIRSEVRRLKRRHGLGLIVIDYIQLVRPNTKSKSDNRVNEVTEITGALKAMAKEFDVPLLALSQLNRGVENREDKRPGLSDLRESGSIEQDSDTVAFIFRDEYYVDREKPVMKAGENQSAFNDRYMQWEDRLAQCRGKGEIIFGKHRHGSTGTVDVHFDGPTTTFSDAARPDHHYDPSRD